MHRMANLVVGVSLALMAAGALAQEPLPASQLPADSLATQQLIAWSWMQKPQPTPQPLPPPDTRVPQPEPQTQSSGSQTPDAEVQSFTGKIVKDGGKYVLKVATNTSYQLEGEGDFAQYENQNVRIFGKLDAGGNTIRVVKVELLS
jgi:hypothetical protein